MLEISLTGIMLETPALRLRAFGPFGSSASLVTDVETSSSKFSESETVEAVACMLETSKV